MQGSKHEKIVLYCLEKIVEKDQAFLKELTHILHGFYSVCWGRFGEGEEEWREVERGGGRWRRGGGGVEEGWRRGGGGVEEGWRRGGGVEEVGGGGW
jgi:hypothetical protein